MRHDYREGSTDQQAVIAAAREALEVVQLEDGRQIVVKPEGFEVEDLTAYQPTPPRIVEARAFHNGDSLARYVSRYKSADTLLVADIERRKIRALIDYHSADGSAENVDHSATWDVQHSEAFKAWSSFEGKLHEQADFIRFLEENATEIATPDPASMLELARDFDAVKSVKFKSSKRLDNGDRALQYTEETGTNGRIEIPEKVTLEMPIFYGEAAVRFQAFFRYRIREGVLGLGYEFHRMQPVLDAAFQQTVAHVAEATGLDPFYGAA